MTAPCKGCHDRTVEPNCHMTCEKYIEYRKKRDEMCEQRRAAKEIDFMRGASVWREARAALKRKKSEGR